MQTSNHFSDDPEKLEVEKQVEQVSPPLYEFPVSSSIKPDEESETVGHESRRSQTKDELTLNMASTPDKKPAPDEDLVRQGLVYPPPPSFYQQAQVVPNQPAPFPPAPSGQPPYLGTLPPQSAGYPPQMGYSQMLPPQFAPPAPVVKKSYRWIWITASILGILLLASCGLCGWAFSQFVLPLVQSETDSITTANNYYAALQNKDYITAYQYVSPQGPIQDMTQAKFTQSAQSADTQYGSVRSYTTTTGSFGANSSTGVDTSHFTVVVNVVRVNKSYDALLTMQKIGKDWKIIDFDRI